MSSPKGASRAKRLSRRKTEGDSVILPYPQRNWCPQQELLWSPWSRLFQGDPPPRSCTLPQPLIPRDTLLSITRFLGSHAPQLASSG